MKNLKIALIGAGYISNYHARGLQALAGVEITVVVGLPIEAARTFAGKYNIKEATTDVSALFDREDIDAVVIGTPNKFHAPYAIEFLKNGKDVFLEKPMAMSAEEGILIKLAADAGNQLVICGGSIMMSTLSKTLWIQDNWVRLSKQKDMGSMRIGDRQDGFRKKLWRVVEPLQIWAFMP
jgi:predicted dinucleotide-utilizing enzyme